MARFHWPGFDSLGKLPSEETAEIAARVAELAKSGLPLGAGLRAVAAEMSVGRTHWALHAMADRLDAGDDLAEVMDREGRRLPACLRGMVLAGLRSGHLAEVLEEYTDLRRSRLETRRRIWLSLAYPFFLFCLLAVLFMLARYFVIEDFAKIFADFDTELPDITKVVIAVAPSLAWIMVSAAVISCVIPLLFGLAAPGVGYLWPFLYKIPLIGSMLRWGNLSQFSRLTALLLEQQTPLPDALRLTAAGLHDPNLAKGCRLLAEDTEKGQSLHESMNRRRQFPSSMIPLVEWGERSGALPDAFRSTSEMFEGRILTHGSLMEALLLPFMLLLIVSFVGFFAIAMMMPLISLITCMS